jgi:2-methylcitrate dehydratase PrpD
MPSALESLAALIQDPALARHAAARMDTLRLHIADTLGMILQGQALTEGKAAMALGFPLVGWCASARLTEADDIHLASCTTPGSVVVPTAIHLASLGAFKTWEEFAVAVLAGYETLIRVGYAINGPRMLHKIWPTLLAAPAGAAAVACRAWKLNIPQTAGALATALAASTGIAAPAMMPNSSRWISLGLATQQGVAAAMAARQGIVGDAGISGALRLSDFQALRRLGNYFLFDDTELKPYPIARQALAAVEACRELVGGKTKRISAITVGVSWAQARIIDQPEWPSNRMQSIAGVQYQIGLALLFPKRLMDFNRTPPFETDAMRSLAAKIRVREDARLARYYPAEWPAYVVVKWTGKPKSMLLTTPRALQWKDVLAKSGSLLDPARISKKFGRAVARIICSGGL